MKVKCPKQALLKGLQTVNAIATQRDLYPILENVKISVCENQILLRATDLKISLTYFLSLEDLEIFETGEILIPAQKLYNLIKETPDHEIVLEKQEQNVNVISQDGHFCIFGEKPENFPEIPEFGQEAMFEITGEDFQDLIKKTLFTTTAEKTRYDLDNVLVDVVGDKIRFVSTDGKRLALCEKQFCVVGEVSDTQFTVPSKGLQQIDRVLNTITPETVKLSLIENQLLFRTQEVMLSTRLSDAKFPPYERVIPSNLPFKATLELKKFISAIRRVCLLADEKDKIVELSFHTDFVKLFAMGEGTGEASVEVPIDFDGEPFDIKFNPTFLLDVMRVIESPKMEIWLQNSQSAALVKDQQDFLYVVLPIKVEEKAE